MSPASDAARGFDRRGSSDTTNVRKYKSQARRECRHGGTHRSDTRPVGDGGKNARAATAEARRDGDRDDRHASLPSRPANYDVDVVLVNASGHKTRPIHGRFAKQPRQHSGFTPTSAPWIAQVKRFRALLTGWRNKRGTYRSTAELETGIQRNIETCNRIPQPFRWTESADDISAIVERFRRCTLSVRHEGEWKLLTHGTSRCCNAPARRNPPLRPP